MDAAPPGKEPFSLFPILVILLVVADVRRSIGVSGKGWIVSYLIMQPRFQTCTAVMPRPTAAG